MPIHDVKRMPSPTARGSMVLSQCSKRLPISQQCAVALCVFSIPSLPRLGPRHHYQHHCALLPAGRHLQHGRQSVRPGGGGEACLRLSRQSVRPGGGGEACLPLSRQSVRPEGRGGGRHSSACRGRVCVLMQKPLRGTEGRSHMSPSVVSREVPLVPTTSRSPAAGGVVIHSFSCRGAKGAPPPSLSGWSSSATSAGCTPRPSSWCWSDSSHPRSPRKRCGHPPKIGQCKTGQWKLMRRTRRFRPPSLPPSQPSPQFPQQRDVRG